MRARWDRTIVSFWKTDGSPDDLATRTFPPRSRRRAKAFMREYMATRQGKMARVVDVHVSRDGQTEERREECVYRWNGLDKKQAS